MESRLGTTPFGRRPLSLAMVAIVLSGVRLRTRAIQDRNRQLERVVRERTSALETRNEEIQALYEADERILRNVSLNQVFQTLVDVAVDMLHADRSVVFAWDERQTKVVPRVSHGFSPETLKVMEFAKNEGGIGKVLAAGAANPAVVDTLVARAHPPEAAGSRRTDTELGARARTFVWFSLVPPAWGSGSRRPRKDV